MSAVAELVLSRWVIQATEWCMSTGLARARVVECPRLQPWRRPLKHNQRCVLVGNFQGRCWSRSPIVQLFTSLPQLLAVCHTLWRTCRGSGTITHNGPAAHAHFKRTRPCAYTAVLEQHVDNSATRQSPEQAMYFHPDPVSTAQGDALLWPDR